MPSLPKLGNGATVKPPRSLLQQPPNVLLAQLLELFNIQTIRMHLLTS
jgi:hypothetical protein